MDKNKLIVQDQMNKNGSKKLQSSNFPERLKTEELSVFLLNWHVFLSI